MGRKKVVNLTKEQVENRLKIYSISQVAAAEQVSYSALRKYCIEIGILKPKKRSK